MAVTFAIALLLNVQSPSTEMPQTSPQQETQRPSRDADDELVCRRRSVPNNRLGRWSKSVKVCKTKAEWAGQDSPED